MAHSITLADNKFVRYFILILVSIVGVSSYVAAEGLFAMENTLLDTDGAYQLTLDEYGALSGAYSLLVVYAGILLLGGVFIDKCGLRLSGIVSTLLLIGGAGLIVFSMIEHRIMISSGEGMAFINFMGHHLRKPILYGILGFALLGAGSELSGVILTKVLSKWFRGQELAFAMASQIAIARIGIGATYGATPYLAEMYGGNVSIPLMIGVGILIIGLLLYLVYCVYDKKLDNQLAATGVITSVIDESDQFHWSDLGKLFKSKAFWMVCLICCFYYGGVRKFDNFAAKFVVDRFDVAPETSGIFILVSSWTIAILTPLLGIYVDKKGKSLDLLIASSIMAVVNFLVLDIMVLPKPLLYCIFVLNGISFSLTAASLWPLVARILDLSVQGTGYAVVFWFQNIMFLLVPRIISNVAESSNQYVLVFCGMTVVSAIAAITFKHMDKRGDWKLNEVEKAED